MKYIVLKRTCSCARFPSSPKSFLLQNKASSDEGTRHHCQREPHDVIRNSHFFNTPDLTSSSQFLSFNSNYRSWGQDREIQSRESSACSKFEPRERTKRKATVGATFFVLGAWRDPRLRERERERREERRWG